MMEFKDVTNCQKIKYLFLTARSPRTVSFSGWFQKTLGNHVSRDYEFGTAEKEIMGDSRRQSRVLLPGAAGWVTFKEGEVFEVPAQSKFSLKVKSLTDYCCSYVK